MLCFQVQRTPIIHAWGFCYNSHKIESLAIGLSRSLDPENGTAFLLGIVNTHLFTNFSLSQNGRPTYSACTMTKNVA